MTKSLILYMKDEGAVNEDFGRYGKLLALERIIKATRGNVIPSFIPARLPNVQHNRSIQVKLLPEVVDYVRMLVEHYKLDLGQLGLYHCCDECYNPEKDKHSHEEYLRHGTRKSETELQEFQKNLEELKRRMGEALEKKPTIFTSPQNWMQDGFGWLNDKALRQLGKDFEFLALTHSQRIFGFPFYKLTKTGTLYLGSDRIKILPTVDITCGDQKAIDTHPGLYVHYDDLLGNGERYVGYIEEIGSQIVKPRELSYDKRISSSSLQADVQRTGFLRRVKEFVR